jgi:hypothetical protein
MKMSIDELRDQLINKIHNSRPDVEFIISIRESEDHKHTISTSYKADSHFGIMHMVTKVCRSWEDENTNSVNSPPIQIIPSHITK